MEIWELDLKCPFRAEKKSGEIVYEDCYKHLCPYFMPITSYGRWCNRATNTFDNSAKDPEIALNNGIEAIK